MKPRVVVPFLVLGLAGFSTRGSPARVPSPSYRILVDAKTPGTVIALHFLSGPDSLAGTARQLAASSTLQVSGDSLVLLAEDAKTHREVVLNVELIGAPLRGTGTGDRVHIEISAAGVHVSTSPWRVPI